MNNNLFKKSNGEEFKCVNATVDDSDTLTLELESIYGNEFMRLSVEQARELFIDEYVAKEYVKELEEWKLKNEVKFKYEIGQELIGVGSKVKAAIKIRNLSDNGNEYYIEYVDGHKLWMHENHIQNNYDIVETKPPKHSGEYVGEFKKSVADEIVELAEDVSELGRFEKIAEEIGSFTQLKNEQYGSSVDATYGMMKVLLERYRYDDKQYLIPEELIQHILLQVRMMDKQNRIFQNPSGEGDSESPYRDLCGYSLIGINMVEK